MKQDLSFAQRFSREPTLIVRSPGRVNLIGEHTDYNLGYVLPSAIDRYTKLAAAPRTDNKLRIYSETMGESLEVDLEGHLGLVGDASHWSNYVRGVAWWLRDQQFTPIGGDVLVWGDLPVGSGLSSSASFTMGLMAVMASLAGWSIPRPTMARAAQSVETEFVGVPVGIMDQLVIGVAEPGSALLIDCRSLSTTPVPLKLESNDLSMVVVNSGVSRDLAGSAYEKRRSECEAAVGALRVVTYDLNIKSLRDVSVQMLTSHGSKLYPTLYKRARHVVTENDRVLQMVGALSVEDYETAGQLMNDSHESLKNDFEVSSPFLDRLVELAQGADGVLGARLTGAGFGGCTVNLVKTEALSSFRREVVRRYEEETSFKADTYVVSPVAGLEVDFLGQQ
ncbi:MAG: galactokinase [Chloroflexia bacterium]